MDLVAAPLCLLLLRAASLRRIAAATAEGDEAPEAAEAETYGGAKSDATAVETPNHSAFHATAVPSVALPLTPPCSLDSNRADTIHDQGAVPLLLVDFTPALLETAVATTLQRDAATAASALQDGLRRLGGGGK